jgi:hypothetical protein
MVLNLRPKCANPSCAASFDWLGGGKFFRFPRERAEPVSDTQSKGGTSVFHPVGHFWLCERCSNIHTLRYEPGRGVIITPLWPGLPASTNNMHLPSHRD